MILSNYANIDLVNAEKGGTGNRSGYIRTGQATGSTVGTGATIEGSTNIASGDYATASGVNVEASGYGSHAEGYSKSSTYKIIASGDGSHAEGYLASGVSSGNEASGLGSHVEGIRTVASGPAAHSEGASTTASGNECHAEGASTTASGNYSHSEGYHNTAGYLYQHVQGKYNNNKSTTLFEIGGGTADNDRKNIFEVYDNGYLSFDDGTSKIKFGVDSNGDYGYIKSGADDIYPFNVACQYSTTEKVVGYWTDGKPVYQKVLSSTLPQAGSDGTLATNLISVGASVDQYVYMYGMVSSNGVFFPLEREAGISGSSLLYARATPRNNSYSTTSERNKVKLENNKASWNGYTVKIIIQYTKTTD